MSERFTVSEIQRLPGGGGFHVYVNDANADGDAIMGEFTPEDREQLAAIALAAAEETAANEETQ